MDMKNVQSAIVEIQKRFDEDVSDMSYRRSGDEVAVTLGDLRFSFVGGKYSLSKVYGTHVQYIKNAESWLDFLEQLENQFPAT